MVGCLANRGGQGVGSNRGRGMKNPQPGCGWG